MLLNSTGDQAQDISFAGITGMAFSPQTGRLYITENDVTRLVVLDAGAAGSSPDAGYLYAAALAVGVAAISLGILWSRRSTEAREGRRSRLLSEQSGRNAP